jgi:phage replication O-like protein O
MSESPISVYFIKIPNIMIETLAKINLRSSEGQLIIAIVRKTIGYHKDQDKISVSQLMKMTGLSRRTVIYGLQTLEARQIISITRNRIEARLHDTNMIGIQFDYSRWAVQEGVVQLTVTPYEQLLTAQRDRYRGKQPSSIVQETEVVQ